MNNSSGKTMELFCGLKSFSKIAREFGFDTFTIDNNPDFSPDLCGDILDFNFDAIEFIPDIIWASPPCETFSVASIGTHWTGGKKAYVPNTKEAETGIALVKKTLEIIDYYKSLNPNLIWFIENPRGVLKNLPIMKDLPIREVWYCRYGDNRAKPTNIWTNMDWKSRPICENGNPDHEAAPRGARTGTQGRKNAKERGIIPPDLFREIFSQLLNRPERKGLPKINGTQ